MIGADGMPRALRNLRACGSRHGATIAVVQPAGVVERRGTNDGIAVQGAAIVRSSSLARIPRSQNASARPRCSAIARRVPLRRDGVTSTRTVRRQVGCHRGNRIAVQPASDMPTTNSAPGASSRRRQGLELSCGSNAHPSHKRNGRALGSTASAGSPSRRSQCPRYGRLSAAVQKDHPRRCPEPPQRR